MDDEWQLQPSRKDLQALLGNRWSVYGPEHSVVYDLGTASGGPRGCIVGSFEDVAGLDVPTAGLLGILRAPSGAPNLELRSDAL